MKNRNLRPENFFRLSIEMRQIATHVEMYKMERLFHSFLFHSVHRSSKMVILSIILGLISLTIAVLAFGFGDYRHKKQLKRYNELKELIDQYLPSNENQEASSTLNRSSTEVNEMKSEKNTRENIEDDTIPEGTKFIVQGIPYASYAQGARDMNCDNAYLRDCIVYQPGSPYGTTFERFIENRMNSNNIEKFKQSVHFKKVVEKYGSYPPPTDVKLLVICDEQPSGVSNGTAPIPSQNQSEEIPEGTKFIVQGIPYASYAQGARDMNCDSAYLRDCIVFKPGSPYGTTFEKFIENRMKPNNVEKFMQSKHYNNVVQKFGSYPPPEGIALLLNLDTTDIAQD